MNCEWQALLSILPERIRKRVDEIGKETLQEIRLRMGQPPKLCLSMGFRDLGGNVKREELDYVVNTASRYSPWSMTSAKEGYLTAQGGHRIGLCGQAVMRDGRWEGLREVSSLCIRVARDFPGIAEGLPMDGSVLIIGKPGAGKTTLLRDLIRRRSAMEMVAVVDERGELLPKGVTADISCDVITHCPKAWGMDSVIRAMGPSTVAVDEITAEADCDAMIRSAGCGVMLLATAHARSKKDLETRPIYRRLLEHNVFNHLVILQPDKSWWTERIR